MDRKPKEERRSDGYHFYSLLELCEYFSNFLSREEMDTVPLSGGRLTLKLQTLKDEEWKIGMHFVDLTEEEKAMLFDRIAYFPFFQDRLAKIMEVRDSKDGKS